MPLLKNINANIFKKENTEADYNRAFGILRDEIVIITASQVSTRIVETGFKYLPGSHELEVYLNGFYQRVNETIDEVSYGTYEEYSNFSVLFNTAVIQTGDVVRFRVTSAYYKISNDISLRDINMLDNNIKQLATDVFGTEYELTESYAGSIRGIGTIPNGSGDVNLSDYRTWYSSVTGGTILNFTGCNRDDIRHIIFQNGLTTISNNGNIRLSQNENFIGTSGQVITFLYTGSTWVEVSTTQKAFKKHVKDITLLDWSNAISYTLYEIDISELNNKNIIYSVFDSTSYDQIEAVDLILNNENYCYINMPINLDQTITFMATTSQVQKSIAIGGWTLSGDLYYSDVNISPYTTLSPIVACYDYTSNKKINPVKIERFDTNNIRIWMNEPILLMVTHVESDIDSTISTGDWISDGSDYYYDIDLSSIDSTAIVTCFWDDDDEEIIFPQKVELFNDIASPVLRVWMPSNTKNLTAGINYTNNMWVEISLTGSTPLKTYASTSLISLDSDDFVVNGMNMLTKTNILFGTTDYDYQLLNRHKLRIWSNVLIPIKVVVIE